MSGVTVVEITVEDAYELRRSVLRDGTPSDEVRFPEDAVAGTFHIGARDGDGRLVATSTYTPSPCPHRPGVEAYQLRGMAVAHAWQGHGVGRAVLDAAAHRIRATGARVLWAWARDSALEFYERFGMTVVGEGWISTETELPHHDVVLDL